MQLTSIICSPLCWTLSMDLYCHYVDNFLCFDLHALMPVALHVGLTVIHIRSINIGDPLNLANLAFLT